MEAVLGMSARNLVRKAAFLCQLRGFPQSFHLQGSFQLVYRTFRTNRKASIWPCRFYATRSVADGYLLELINSEIQQDKQPPVPERADGKVGMVGPFVLIDKPGMEDVLLTRTVGTEKMEIVCMLEKQYPEDEDEQEESKLQHKYRHNYNEQKKVPAEGQEEIVEVLHFSVNMTKGGAVKLELDCSYVRGASEVMVESVFFHEPHTTTSPDQPEPYGGPIFEDLDEDLQRAFHDLLKVRGLSAGVARYMIDYMSGKEKREYIRWLQRLKDFFAC